MTDYQVSLSPDEQIDTVNEHVRLIRRKNGLTFGTDAYLLAAFVRPQPHETVVDLGSGTGILPLLLLARGKIRTAVAVEIQDCFADLIGRNAALNGVSDRVRVLCTDVRDLHPRDTGGEVALVVSNPPYMKTETGKRNAHDEKFIARHEVFGGIGDFCAAASRVLKHGGRFVCVFRPDRLTELLSGMRDAHLEPKRMVFVHADEESEPSSVLIEAVKGGAPSLRIDPPLLLHACEKFPDGTRKLTARAQKIYDTCSFFD
ncbi:MAG: methyltransferase [Clostridia bacterium]|nr:methyltransferase [Clostridia bacterium]